MVRFLSTSASPLVDPLVNRLVSTYNIHPHSCFLYLASILVSVKPDSNLIFRFDYHLFSSNFCFAFKSFKMISSLQVDEFGRMPNCVPGLIQLVNTLAATTFQTLNSPVALEQNPDTIEDLFRYFIHNSINMSEK